MEKTIWLNKETVNRRSLLESIVEKEWPEGTGSAVAMEHLLSFNDNNVAIFYSKTHITLTHHKRHTFTISQTDYTRIRNSPSVLRQGLVNWVLTKDWLSRTVGR